MSKRLHRNLGQLHDLRTQALERAQADWAEKQRVCERTQGTAQRLESLAQTAAAPAGGTLTPSLLGNQAAYKEALLALARSQRQALAQSRLEAASAQAVVVSEARQQAVLEKAQDQVGARLKQAEQRQEQKIQDDLATQVWLRGGSK